MATWRNRGLTLQLEGFDELVKALQKADKSIDFEVEKCFSQCCKVITDTLKEKAQQAELDADLINKITRDKRHNGNRFYFEVGWKKVAPTKSNPIPDVYKVMFYNYGTPQRTTKAGANRGEEKKHGFIKKAKLASKNKVKKLQKDFLKDALKDLQS